MGKVYNEATAFLSILKKQGITGWLVGGCVRDWVKNGCDDIPRDIDIAVNASAEYVESKFTRSHRMSNRHQTIIIRHGGGIYELTELKGADIYEDLSSRDFTCNAMAVDIDGNLLDPHDGVSAVRSGFIKAVDQSRFIQEDPLRMLRALRFSAQFGWFIDTETEAACKKEIKKLQETAVERVKEECSLLINGGWAASALRKADHFGMFHYFPSSIRSHPLCLWRYPTEKLEDGVLRWTGLLLMLYGETASIVLGSWTFSNQQKKQIRELLDAVKGPVYKQDLYTLYALGREQAVRGYLLHQWKYRYTPDEQKQRVFYERLNTVSIQSISDLAVNGRDIQRRFPELPSSLYGPLLRFLEKKVVLEEITNDKHTLLEQAGTFIRNRGRENSER
ncbi:hypothetical protein [Sinobaca sp. H24]|uniref:hypothetical protein n=1 Tax=Sinobaca sp. H24 TaxID=2923376 RepID=UPI002079DFF1|nr:hypothetical protein [Sinobaca sp. H24]